MRYVIPGYVFILVVLFLYAVQLVWRRRRLIRAVARVSTSAPDSAPGSPVSHEVAALETPAASQGAP